MAFIQTEGTIKTSQTSEEFIIIKPALQITLKGIFEWKEKAITKKLGKNFIDKYKQKKIIY